MTFPYIVRHDFKIYLDSPVVCPRSRIAAIRPFYKTDFPLAVDVPSTTKVNIQVRTAKLSRLEPQMWKYSVMIM